MTLFHNFTSKPITLHKKGNLHYKKKHKKASVFRKVQTMVYI